MKNIKKTRSIIMLVFILVAISLFSTSTLAKYVSSEDGTSSLAVASFSNDVIVEVETLTIGVSNSNQFEFTVQNDSDVSVNYQVIAVSTGNLPLDFTLNLMDGDDVATDQDGNPYSITVFYQDEEDFTPNTENEYFGDSYTFSDDYMELACTTNSDIAVTSEGYVSHEYELSLDFNEDINYQQEYNGMLDVVQIYVVFNQNIQAIQTQEPTE